MFYMNNMFYMNIFGRTLNVLLLFTNIMMVGSTTSWCSNSPSQLCRMGCMPAQCGNNQCAMRQGTCCSYNCKSTLPECSCALGYRNGARVLMRIYAWVLQREGKDHVILVHVILIGQHVVLQWILEVVLRKFVIDG